MATRSCAARHPGAAAAEELRHGAARAGAGPGSADLARRDPAAAQGRAAEAVRPAADQRVLAAPLKITADAKDAGISTPFRRCVPAGCFAEIEEPKDDLQKKFRAAAAEPGKIVFKDAADRDVAIPLSFKGFAQAFEALLKQ